MRIYICFNLFIHIEKATYTNRIANLGFRLVTPQGGHPSQSLPPTTTYTVGENITVRWDLGHSLVTKFVAIELFSSKGLIQNMWIGKIPAVEKSKEITLNVNDYVEIPGTYFFRVWGESSNGPSCITYSESFRLVAPSFPGQYVYKSHHSEIYQHNE